MYIDHIAIWVRDLEKIKSFYIKYFNCNSNNKYINKTKGFESYFLSFENGSKIEIMKMSNIPENKNNIINQYLGIIHIAIKVNSKKNVDKITEKLKEDGIQIISKPRKTGDGYYESCILDPEGNRVEIIS
ncbi:MAG: VOC family protein [Spirochaetes bacterium]|nr:VOC family protein [Spirochaetota bacterium]